jgi:hypothetical protein
MRPAAVAGRHDDAYGSSTGQSGSPGMSVP